LIVRPIAVLGTLVCACAVLASCAKESEKTAVPAPGAEVSQAPGSTSPSPVAGEIPIEEMPKLLTAPVTYPDEAREKGEEGTVFVKARIGTDGSVLDALAEPDSNASPALEKAALESVKSWTFTPAKAKSGPVETWVVVPVKYTLK
jgi:protein TonB